MHATLKNDLEIQKITPWVVMSNKHKVILNFFLYLFIINLVLDVILNSFLMILYFFLVDIVLVVYSTYS
jgi:hypothetical protein